eukprot:1855789-Pyramimonas_sp.AAC.1
MVASEGHRIANQSLSEARCQREVCVAVAPRACKLSCRECSMPCLPLASAEADGVASSFQASLR